MSRPTVSWPGAPAHLIGELRHVYAKVCAIQMRLGRRGRRHRLMAVHRASGHEIRRNKWDTAYDRWQDRYQQISDRLRPYEKIA
jgi:hypothetical protein